MVRYVGLKSVFGGVLGILVLNVVILRNDLRRDNPSTSSDLVATEFCHHLAVLCGGLESVEVPCFLRHQR